MIYSTFYQSYISVYYIAYQDYIVKELCVQKDNQQGCNGKCYLMNSLNYEISENDATLPPNGEQEFRGNFVFYIAKNTSIYFKNISEEKLEISEYTSDLKQSLFIDKETPPPKFFM